MLLRLWRDPAWRAVFFQVLLIALVFLGGAWIVNNTLTNLESRGISTGFDFLSQTAGFGINQTLIEYDESFSFMHTFVVGLLNTLLVSSLGVLFATVLGFLMGVARLSSNWLLAKIAAVYIEIFRNIPLLLQIFFWYFAVLGVLPSPRQSISLFDSVFLNVRGVFFPAPVLDSGGMVAFWAFLAAVVIVGVIVLLNRRQRKNTGRPLPWIKTISLAVLLGLPTLSFWLTNGSLHWDFPALKGFNFRGGVGLLPELVALWFALTIYTAAFIAEVVRSGIESVSKGQKEAAAALGLRPGRVMNLVVIPQAMRVIIPPLTNQYLNLIKNSSLATAIGYPDLVNVFAGTTLNQTGQAIEVIAMTMAVYLTISLTVSLLMNMYNRWVALVER
ncbi:amino acid ABC transporter permease [Endozoicomonas sp. OPT23]|uniref:amino acid ABC transporter permease n=1 Tax=Endozoicomonas sp. OPT23 TaxID=2072845 RepID=UPI00129B4D89|nr:amino acid ABC transporter permease [Endozoicomonas sp. OPT23]MRI34082.1 amino acid ABC transporter permease [Endozoicomonas sp. OPT23]